MKAKIRTYFFKAIISLGAFLGFAQCVVAQYGVMQTTFEDLDNVDQAIVASGVVYAQDENKGVEGFKVYVLGSDLGDTVYTDEHGRFQVKIPPNLIKAHPKIVQEDVDGNENGWFGDTTIEVDRKRFYFYVKQKPNKEDRPAQRPKHEEVIEEEKDRKKNRTDGGNGPSPEADLPEAVLPLDAYKPNNIVFLLDVSSSMEGAHRLDYLKTTMISLLENVRDVDQITIVTFSDHPNILQHTISGSEKRKLIKRVKMLKVRSQTGGSRALKLAYNKAMKSKIEDGNNQVILITDGEFNLGELDVTPIVANGLSDGIKLSVVAINSFGKYEQGMFDAAEAGAGCFLKVDSEEAAKNCLINEVKKQSEIK